MKVAVRREVDVILAWFVDRFGDSLQHLVGFLSEIHVKGVYLYLHQQGIDTTTPDGKAMFQIAGVFAEFERAMIRASVKAGLQRANVGGKRLGPPRLDRETETRVLKLPAQEMGIDAIAREVCGGSSVVQRTLGETRSHDT